ncbi:MAG: RNA methyltransferase [Candidatus Binataceae bacterium]
MGVAENFAFVLVRPRSAGNIGAAARALKNMGFADLRLAGPAAANGRMARAMAVHARDVLDGARRFATLGDAVADSSVVVGTTCRSGPYRNDAREIRGGAPELAQLAASNRVALVFGTEDRGLTNRELKLCQRLVTIPGAPDYRSLNVAQAVMVTAYELMLAVQPRPDAEHRPAQLAPAGEVDAMLERMGEALVSIGFLPADNPDHIMFALRAILGRSGVNSRELDILNGIARQMRWVAEGGNATLDAKRRAGEKLR